MELSADKVRNVTNTAVEPISLMTQIGEEEDNHIGDFLEDKSQTSPSESMINHSLSEQTTNALATLTLREAKVLRMRFSASARRTTIRSRKSARTSTLPASGPFGSKPRRCGSSASRHVAKSFRAFIES